MPLQQMPGRSGAGTGNGFVSRMLTERPADFRVAPDLDRPQINVADRAVVLPPSCRCGI